MTESLSGLEQTTLQHWALTMSNVFPIGKLFSGVSCLFVEFCLAWYCYISIPIHK